jgi:hypothetical protein
MLHLNQAVPLFHSRWLSSIVLFCLATAGGSAQLGDLVTTYDGSVLYFSSTRRLTEAAQYSNRKIYRFADGSIELVAQVIPNVRLSDGSDFHFNFRMPGVSDAGDVVTFDGTASCWGGPSCNGAFTARGFVSGALLPTWMTSYGSLRVSPNGRYFLRFGGIENPGTPMLFDRETSNFSFLLNCGAPAQSCGVPGEGKQALADDGTVVTFLGLWREGVLTSTPRPLGLAEARLSGDGSTIVYTATTMLSCLGGALIKVGRYYQTLYVWDPRTGVEMELERSPELVSFEPDVACRGRTTFFHPSLSRDGRTVLFRSGGPCEPPQAVIVGTDGSRRRVLTTESAGIGEVVLSGDSQRAYAATRTVDFLRSMSNWVRSVRCWPEAYRDEGH